MTNDSLLMACNRVMTSRASLAGAIGRPSLTEVNPLMVSQVRHRMWRVAQTSAALATTRCSSTESTTTRGKLARRAMASCSANARWARVSSIAGQPTIVAILGRRARKALPRWLMACLSAGDSSALVTWWPSGWKIGS